jgi:PPOX class probable F420-dependent enzyme
VIETNPFQKQSYISVETYRKNGQPVLTPVWFAQDQNSQLIYIWTSFDSGKSKRIRNNPDVKIAPSTMNGTPKSAYLDARAQIAKAGSTEFEMGVSLINKKYGLQKKIIDLLMGNKGNNIIIVLQLTH